MNAPLRLFLLLLVATVLAGCSSYERTWRAAGAGPVADQFSGPWDGEWMSEKHRGSGGRLRCVLTRVAGGKYRARFRANWLVFAGGYTVLLDGERRGNELRLSGQHRLSGIGGGVYRYEGKVTRRQFSVRYDSAYDSGRFNMSRPSFGDSPPVARQAARGAP